MSQIALSSTSAFVATEIERFVPKQMRLTLDLLERMHRVWRGYRKVEAITRSPENLLAAGFGWLMVQASSHLPENYVFPLGGTIAQGVKITERIVKAAVATKIWIDTCCQLPPACSDPIENPPIRLCLQRPLLQRFCYPTTLSAHEVRINCALQRIKQVASICLQMLIETGKLSMRLMDVRDSFVHASVEDKEEIFLNVLEIQRIMNQYTELKAYADWVKERANPLNVIDHAFMLTNAFAASTHKIRQLWASFLSLFRKTGQQKIVSSVPEKELLV